MSDLLERLRERDIPDYLRGLYSLIYLATFMHAITTRGAWMCCPPAYGDDLGIFAHAVQTALGWTGAAVSILEVLTVMVLLVPKVYYGIKEKGRREGKAEGERAERERIAAALDAAGITDPETRRIVMNGHYRDDAKPPR